MISSYHREYLWSQDTNRGLLAAMTELGYLDDRAQAQAFTADDRVDSSRAVLRKLWMDTKRHPDDASIGAQVARIAQVVEQFRPDVLLLGDDNAANYIGNRYLDTDIPIVFWGVNGLPLKYGLIDAIERPGHNITGVYQAGYLAECLAFLQRIVPDIRTVAVLADDSPTGRSKAKTLASLSERGQLPVQVVGSVVTNSLSEWQRGARQLADAADSIFLLNHNTLVDDAGRPVDPMTIGAWYLRTIRLPDCGHERQFAVEGVLATADDSGFNQAYEAVQLAHRILASGASPADIPVRAPERGPLIVNRARARMLGIELRDDIGAEEFIDTALALEPR